MGDIDGCEVLDDLAARFDASRHGVWVLEDLGCGDGLPVAPVDEALVGDFVVRSGMEADTVVVVVPPLRGVLTARRLGVLGALAGCEPRHMPVLVAAASALGEPDLNALGVLSTTGAAALMTVVHGPLGDALGFNSGGNCLGPGSRANATVGRCLSLVCRIVGGARQGVADMATMGQPGKYSFCFAENHAASPWPPYHEERGRPPGSSAVTVAGVGGTVEAFDQTAAEPEAMVRALGRALAGAGPVVHEERGLVGGGHQYVLVSPEWAELFGRAGWTRARLGEALFDEGRRRAGLRVAETPSDIVVLVAGGVGIKQTVVPGWSGWSSPVTVAVAATGR